MTDAMQIVTDVTSNFGAITTLAALVAGFFIILRLVKRGSRG